MPDLRALALDLSLTATGYAHLGCTGTHFTKDLRGMDRLADVRHHVLDLTLRSQADLVVLEGYSFGSHASHAHELGELGGAVRLALWDALVPVVDVAPASLKKYACGKGNANKGQMLEAAVKRSGLDFDGDNNRADAWWLWAMVLDAYGTPVVEMPQANREALAGVVWPRVGEMAACSD